MSIADAIKYNTVLAILYLHREDLQTLFIIHEFNNVFLQLIKLAQRELNLLKKQ